MPLMAFYLQCAPALRCFSVMLHNVWRLGVGVGAWPPCPLNPLLHADNGVSLCTRYALTNAMAESVCIMKCT